MTRPAGRTLPTAVAWICRTKNLITINLSKANLVESGPSPQGFIGFGGGHVFNLLVEVEGREPK
jgi:hypothetical protein